MTYTVLTLGCKVNQFETQAMETLLAEHGFTKSEEGGADVIIVNTCAVTAESGRKSRQAIRKLKGENPDAVLAVCGCYSQTAPEDAEELGADIVYGSGDRRKMVEDV
ncbi:MAG: tRNA (N(6)-L-threonylcarbamoyladenosine(37)-C(2))-methylthiotransferase MtaB, partial [Oscillospiraceae bacterium]|nr:tRNA (N(6)-L-threonylcarbamoyladenosine(37)-C(2))-methylthiotransferase MtaB [Oscillospiraceae bacterium]